MTKIGFISFFFIWQQRPISEMSRSSVCDSYTNLFIQGRLPPEVNRILYVKLVPKVTFDTCRNLPYKITNEEIYDIFGKYGDIRQIRVQESNFDFWAYYLVVRPKKREERHLSFTKTFMMQRTPQSIYPVSTLVEGTLQCYISRLQSVDSQFE